jgi:hypothetical protein
LPYHACVSSLMLPSWHANHIFSHTSALLFASFLALE